MPTYVYKFIDTGETVEVQQSFSDDTLTEHVHPSTGELMAVKKVFLPVGVTFKGDGFYKTDSRSTSKSSKSGSTADGDSGGSSSSESGSTSGSNGSSDSAGSSPATTGSASAGSASTSSATSTSASSSGD